MDKTVSEQIEAAYREGWSDGSTAPDGSSHYEDADWRQSNARRIAESLAAAPDEADGQSQQGGEAGRSEGCVWRDNGDFWEASCDGVAWYFDTGGTPADHGMKYCFSCGRPIAAAPEQAEEDGEGE